MGAENPVGWSVMLVHPTSLHRHVAESDEAEMHLLAVLPQARGKGVGQSLEHVFEEGAVAAGFARFVLSSIIIRCVVCRNDIWIILRLFCNEH